MENNASTELNKKVEINLKKNNSFHIRRRKTFLIDQKPKIHKNELKKRNTYGYDSYNGMQNQRKMSFHRNRRRSSLTKDFKAIEQDVRCSILEMRRNCLWEIRRQSHDIENIFENVDKTFKTKSSLGNMKKKISMKFLEDLYINKEDNNMNKIKKFNTFKIKKVKYNNESNSQNNKISEINDNINHDFEEKNKKKYISSKILFRLKHQGKNSHFPRDKFRFLGRGGQIIDSNNENESDEESDPEGFLINPETKFIFIYDAIIAIVALYSLIYIPIELANNYCFCSSNINIFKTFINFIFDILFIIDLFTGFFREFYTKEDEKLIKNKRKIFNNYVRGYFFLDLLTSLPINILIFYICKRHNNEVCFTFQKSNNSIYYLMLSRCLKSIKLFKIAIRKKNQFVTQIVEKCSDYSILDEFMELFSKISFVIAGLHLLSRIYIFIGRHVYPGWIFKNEFQNYSSLNLYMISLYYMITTMTTVGYGEIQSDSFIEIVFRIILLAVGIICYSWLISSISNGINKQSYASINYSNECLLLENIRRSHRDLPYKIYFAVKKHLEYKHFRQKKFDKDLLINNLPYSLKNNLIFSMYKPAIEKFHFFKGISNTNFLTETLSYFTPISGKQNEIFIKENEIIEEIYFVKEGRLALEVPINMDNPEESVNKYLSNDFLDFAFDFDCEANYNPLPYISNINNSNLYDNSECHGGKRSTIINSIIFKNKETKKNIENNIYLKIHDIHKNEDFGDIYVFFTKRSPFALRAKTKRVKLYGIKKEHFINLCEEYQHLFRRINKKKKHNYKIIKNILIKTISKFCDVKGIKIKDMFKEKIHKANRELQKENFPNDILKNSKNKNEINEIDEQINSTIKEFDTNIKSIIDDENYDIKKKKKINKLLKISTTTEANNKKDQKKVNLYNTNIKGTTINKKIKKSFLKDYNLEGITNNYNFTKSFKEKKEINCKNKNLIRKNNNKKEKKQIKTIISSNITSNLNLKGYNFDFTESDESIKTVKIKDNEESFESSPNTLKILPQSLINLLKIKMNYQQLLNKKEITINSPIFATIHNNNNIINNFNNSNSNDLYGTNKANNQTKINSNFKSKNMSSSGFTFDKLLNKELSNIINSKIEKSSYSKGNHQNKRKLSKVSSIRDTLSPVKIFSPKNKGKTSKISIFSPKHFNINKL